MGDKPKEGPLPPYGSIGSFRKFFELLERRTVEKITEEIIRQNNLTSRGNEYKLFHGLRFLDLIDETGNATEKLRSLHFVGEEFTRNLNNVVREAYKDLLSEIDMTSSREQITNSLMKVYGVARGLAKEAVRIFIYLGQKAGISLLSQETALPLKTRLPKKISLKELGAIDPFSRILISAELHNGNFKKRTCLQFNGDFCEAWSWREQEFSGLNQDFVLGKPLKKEERLFVNPHPFFCASCPRWRSGD